MELYCPRCESAQKNFKLIMPTSVMVVNSDDGFKTANLAELRNIADLLTEAVCKVCKSKLDFIPDEYSEYGKNETINDLDSIDLGSELGPDPLIEEPESIPDIHEPESRPKAQQYRITAGVGQGSSWSHQ